jgi:tetratricopeptide (TPR) repeat protein
MGNFAVHDINDVISAWLARHDKEITPVLPRALQWLDKAIEGKEEERFGPFPCSHRRTLHWAKALGHWMHGKGNDEASWKTAQDAEIEYMRTGFTKVLGVDKFDYKLQRFVPQEIKGLPYSSRRLLVDGTLDDFMAFSLQAGQYDTAVEEYERHLKPKNPSLKTTLKPRAFAYALCLKKLGRARFGDNDLLEAGQRMLRANLEETWLGVGQYERAATWLKIVYWDRDQTLTPLETILKAYDNMPNVPLPDFMLATRSELEPNSLRMRWAQLVKRLRFK